jgi:drug/metabolite transporter (DMT)-like permease
MLLGLERLSAFTASLLLNLETPSTLVLAVFLCKEHLGTAALVTAICIFAVACYGSGRLRTLRTGDQNLWCWTRWP